MADDRSAIRYEKIRPRRGSDRAFIVGLSALTAIYALLILMMLFADVLYMGLSKSPEHGAIGAIPVLGAFVHALGSREIRNAVNLTMVSCTLAAILSVFVAVPAGYLLSRYRFRGRDLIDALFDIPIVLPPLVVGLSLLIMFQFMPRGLREYVVYQRSAVVIAQFVVACAFAIRTMRATFDQIDQRCEQVALTLGCSRTQAFMSVALPEAWPGVLTAGTLAWARALGEFGPLLIFAGATRNKTEVLSTTVFLELSVGDLAAAVAVSLLMVAGAVIVVLTTRTWGSRAFAL
jgi:molybdate transport system permease protein